MATLRLRPVTGIRGGSWVSSPRRTRATRVRRRRCNSVGVPGGASGPLTTGMCEHVVAGCHRALTCLGQRGVGAKPCNSPQVRTPALSSGGHRLPRAQVSLYREPQDCSDDSAAGQCVRVMHHLLPSRFRRLPVERLASAPRPPGEIKCVTTWHREPPWTGGPKASRLRIGAPRFHRYIRHREPRLQQLSILLLSARVGSARRSRSTTFGASPNIGCVHEIREHP